MVGEENRRELQLGLSKEDFSHPLIKGRRSIMHHRSCASILVYSRNLGYANKIVSTNSFALASVCNLGDRSIPDMSVSACLLSIGSFVHLSASSVR